MALFRRHDLGPSCGTLAGRPSISFQQNPYRDEKYRSRFLVMEVAQPKLSVFG